MRMQQHIIRTAVYQQEDGVGEALITPLPGDDSGIAVMHGVYLPAEERGKGIGTQQHKD
jgi:hypothetical protein